MPTSRRRKRLPICGLLDPIFSQITELNDSKTRNLLHRNSYVHFDTKKESGKIGRAMASPPLRSVLTLFALVASFWLLSLQLVSHNPTDSLSAQNLLIASRRAESRQAAADGVPAAEERWIAKRSRLAAEASASIAHATPDPTLSQPQPQPQPLTRPLTRPARRAAASKLLGEERSVPEPLSNHALAAGVRSAAVAPAPTDAEAATLAIAAGTPPLLDTSGGSTQGGGTPTGAAAGCNSPARPYHTLLTASSGNYQLWQSRVMYHHFKLQQAPPARFPRPYPTPPIPRPYPSPPTPTPHPTPGARPVRRDARLHAAAHE